MKLEKRYKSDECQHKAALLALMYGRYYEAWKDIKTDDRLIFCNTYKMLFEALDEMDNVNSTYIWVAFNAAVREDRAALMDEILVRFTGDVEDEE